MAPAGRKGSRGNASEKGAEQEDSFAFPHDKVQASELRVLIVDDDSVDRMALCRALRSSKLNTRIDEVADLKSAMKAIRDDVYDVVILDHLLPDGKSLDFLRDLRSRGIRIPIVVTTGYGDEMLVIELLKTGAGDYLSKDKITPDRIFRAVSHAIHVFRLQEEQTRKDALLEASMEASVYLHAHADRRLAIDGALGILGRAIGADRMIVFEQHPHPETAKPSLSHRYEWARNSPDLKINDPARQNVSWDQLGIARWQPVLLAGHPVGGTMDSFPPNERADLEARGIRSLLAVPVMIDGQCWGFVRIEDRQPGRKWSEREKGILLTVATGIGSTLRRRHLATEVRADESRLREIMDREANLVCRFGPDHMLTFVNEAYCHYFGKTPEDLIGQSFLALVPGAAHEGILAHLKSLTPVNPAGVNEHEGTYADGTLRWQRWINQALFDPDGRLIEYQSCGHDVTDLKQAAHLLTLQRDLAVRLASAATVEEAMALALETTCGISTVDMGLAMALDPAIDEFRLVSKRNAPPELVQQSCGEDAGQLYLSVTAGEGRPVYELAPDMPQGITEAMRRGGVKAIAMVPVGQGSLPAGAFCLASRTVDTFPADARSAMEAMAAQVGGTMERIRARESYHRSQGELRELIETSRTVLWKGDLEGRMLYVNAIAEILFGYRPEELIGKSFADITPPRDRERNAAMYRAAQAAGQTRFTHKTLIVQKSGPLRTVLVSAFLVRDTAGEPAGWQGTCIDITDRENAEVALQLSEEQYRTLVENLNVGVFRTSPDPRGHFVQANPAHARILGYDSVEELVKVPIVNLYEDPRERARILDELRTNGLIRNHEFRLRRKDGTGIWASISAVAHRNTSGQIEWIDGFIEEITERRALEESLRSSRNYLDTIINAIGDPIFVKDRQHRFVMANDALCRLVGHSREELLGRDDYDFFPEEQVHEFWANDELVLSTGKDNLNEESIQDSGGGIRTILTHKTRYTNSDGEHFIVGTIHDMTARRKAEEALRQSEENYRTLVNDLTVGVFRLGGIAVEGFIHVNPEFARMFGYASVEDVMKVSISDLYADPARREDLLSTLRRAGSLRQAEILAKRKDGSTFSVAITAKVRGGPAGEASWVDGIIEDITDRRRAEQALRESEARYRSLAEGSPDMIWLCDYDGTILYVNSFGARQFGVTPDAMIGKTQADFFPPENAARHLKAIRGVFADGKGVSSEVPEQIRESQSWIDSRLVPIKDPDGKVTAVLGISRDITGRKRVEEERQLLAASLLEVQEKERKEISGMLHDQLGQLLTLAKLELGSVKAQDDASRNSLTSAVDRLQEALDSVRRLAVSLRPPILDDLGIPAALEILVDEFTDSSQFAATFTCKGPGPNLSTEEETCLYRILQESLTNIAKHAGATQVDITLETDDLGVRLDIHDNGRGIDEERMSDAKGLGVIGMRERLRRCRGSLEVISDDGKGTRLIARLPAAARGGES